MNDHQQMPPATALPGSQSDAVLGILQTACDRLQGLEKKLENIANLGFRLEAVENGQKEIKDKIDKSAEAHQLLQQRYLDQSHKHELQIQAIQLKLKNYDEIVKKVEELDRKVFGYVLVAVVGGGVVGALFTGLPAWLERHQPQKDGSIMPPSLARWRG